MNQSDSKAIRYAVAGLSVLALLILIEWFSLREAPTPKDEQPATTVTASPRDHYVAPLFAPTDDQQHEAPASQVIERAETNAAVVYRQAFALYDALSKEQKEIVSNWRTNVDASVEAELCEKIQPICNLMHEAVAVSNCDWGLEQPIVFSTLLPHLRPCRDMARAAVWNVAHCRTDDPSAAVDDLAATWRLGQNLTSPPLLIGHMVNLAIQGMVIDFATDHASLLTSAGDTRLVELLNDSNYDEGSRRAIEQEADVISREAEMLARMSPEEAMRELTGLGEDYSSQIQSMGLMQAIANLRQVAELEGQFAKALELPEAEYREWLASLEAVRKTNPFVDFLLTPIESPVNKMQAMTVMSTMAAAGLAVMQDGPDALLSHPDPTTGQPFTYTPTSEGFELQSGYQFKGEPVKLRFK